jgi:phosphoribosylanthranilate isomerase
MPRTRIKICGITRPEDAAAAAWLGADAIGMVFYPPASRNISLERARKILSVLPPFVTPVGIFVDEDPQEILDLTAQLNLRHIQLNGNESPDLVAELRGLRIIKATRVVRGEFEKTLREWRDAVQSLELTNLAGIVLETGGTKASGGTGVPNDWTTVREAKRAGAFEGLPAVIAAGGLTADTVGPIVRDIRPFAVDVSSGVESSLGVKSEEKIAAFIRAVQAVDREEA